MNTKKIWLLVSCLIVATILIMSCAPEAAEEEGKTVTGEVTEEEEVVEEEEEEVGEEKEMVRDSLGRLVEKPRYGGSFTLVLDRDPDFNTATLAGGIPELAFEALTYADWKRGPSGTGEFDHQTSWPAPPEGMGGILAESWEQVDVTTIIFHLREGVRFHDKPPVNGREMTADDFVFSFEYYQSNPRSPMYKWPGTPEENYLRASALDKYTLEVIIPEPDAMWLNDWAYHLLLLPPELEEYDLLDWKNHVGTGAFTTVDYVAGSSTMSVKNPNYWQHDPFHPDNRLPYVDSVKTLIIADEATRMSALRTGKLDRIYYVSWLQAKSLIETNPNLIYSKSSNPNRITMWMRVDVEPFNDKNVRRALSMAIDREEIVRDYFDGDATKLTWPYWPHHGSDYYTPLEELPESCQELYEYDLEEARRLLAEAGYPNGFETNIICRTMEVEQLSLVKEYFEDIDVDLELRVVEPATYGAMFYQKSYTAMLVGTAWHCNPPEIVWRQYYKAGHIYNGGMIDDPYIEEQYAKACNTIDPAEQKRILKELGVYGIDQCWVITMPAGAQYCFWQPWVKGYSGELFTGSYWNLDGFAIYSWFDEDLKKELGF